MLIIVCLLTELSMPYLVLSSWVDSARVFRPFVALESRPFMFAPEINSSTVP